MNESEFPPRPHCNFCSARIWSGQFGKAKHAEEGSDEPTKSGKQTVDENHQHHLNAITIIIILI